MNEQGYKTISEVASQIGVETHTLRFWEGKFPYLNPKKINGNRYYTKDDINYIGQIKNHLKDKGYTIKGVNTLIKDIGVDEFKKTNQQSQSTITTDSIKMDNIKPVESTELPFFGEVEKVDEPPLPMFADTIDEKGKAPAIDTSAIVNAIDKLKKIREKL
ncbi:MAG: MerR family transcriptional regulator [Alphaproteobacteria bacterium]